jgi:hypothetical protein
VRRGFPDLAVAKEIAISKIVVVFLSFTPARGLPGWRRSVRGPALSQTAGLSGSIAFSGSACARRAFLRRIWTPKASIAAFAF